MNPMLTRILLLSALVVTPLWLPAQTPTVIECAGRVVVDGTNFTSTAAAPGYFKCIQLTKQGGNEQTIWSNDGCEGTPAGSGRNGQEPRGTNNPCASPGALMIELKPGDSVAPYAVAGQFKVRLGDGLQISPAPLRSIPSVSPPHRRR